MSDLLDENYQLKKLYQNHQYKEMCEFIDFIMRKYTIEVNEWNFEHPIPAQTYPQLYCSVENFLKKQGNKILIKNGIDISKELLGEN